MLQQMLAPSENLKWPRSLPRSVGRMPMMGAGTGMSQAPCLSPPGAADYLTSASCVDYRDLTSDLGSRCDFIHFTEEDREIQEDTSSEKSNLFF